MKGLPWWTIAPLGIALFAACRSESADGAPLRADSRVACVAGTRRVSTTEGRVSLCLPEAYSPRGAHGFARSRGDTFPEDWIALSIDSASEWSPADPWPLQLASGPTCLADCATVERLRPLQDTVAGARAIGEIGLVSGGFSGEVATPSLVLSAELADGQRLVVNAHSPSLMMIDTLLSYTRTAQVVAPPVSRAAP